MPDRNFLSDEEAARLWARAAELQAEAAERTDAPPEEAATPEDDDAAEGYALEHVRQAAVEAGIGAEFIEEALQEIGAERVLPAPPGGVLDRAARIWLRNPDDYLEVSRVIMAPVDTVLRSMEKLLPNAPFKLVLKDQHGDPRSGGVLVFDIDGAGFVATEGWTGQASWADMREVYASVRRIPSDPERCELTVRSPVAWARPLNIGIGAGITGMGTFFGSLVSVALGEALTDAFAGSTGFILAFTVMLVALGIGTGVPAMGFRVLYDSGLNKGRKALTTLVTAVAQDAQGGWGVGTFGSAETPALPTSEGSDPES